MNIHNLFDKNKVVNFNIKDRNSPVRYAYIWATNKYFRKTCHEYKWDYFE